MIYSEYILSVIVAKTSDLCVYMYFYVCVDALLIKLFRGWLNVPDSE